MTTTGTTKLSAVLLLFCVAAAHAQAKFPWKLDREYVVAYRDGTLDVGTERVTFRQVRRDGQEMYEVKSAATLRPAGQTMKSTTTFLATLNAAPLELLHEIESAAGKTRVNSRFRQNTVATAITGVTDLRREEVLRPNTFCFEGSILALGMLAATQFKLETGKKTVVSGYYASAMQAVLLNFDARTLKPIDLGGKSLECYECVVDFGQPGAVGTAWITKDGRLVKFQMGQLTIEVLSLD